jgi:hypothetical protein
MTVATGRRVSRNTHAPLTLPGMLSTAGHCDQSSVAMIIAPSFLRAALFEGVHADFVLADGAVELAEVGFDSVEPRLDAVEA